MRRIVVCAVAGLTAAVLTPTGVAAAKSSAGAGSPNAASPATARAGALPPHSQRPVCAPPAAGTARCHAHVVTHKDSAEPLATTTYANGYSSAELQAAYQLPLDSFNPNTDPGTGQLVAIVDAYDNPNAEADLAAYRAEFGLGVCSTTNGCFKKVNQRGGSADPVKDDSGWGTEIDLDIEMVSAACPSCRILLVEADDSNYANILAAVDRAVAMNADFISNSYGSGEFSSETSKSYDGHFNHPSIGITVSSGDNGYGAEWPAASQYVTAVGGTSLAADGTETAWSGAGSGCSAVEPSAELADHDIGCGSRRTIADVSAVADPNTGVAVYDSFGSSGNANWYVYGGTSVAAPLVAGVWALAGPNPVGSPASETPYLSANADGWSDVVGGTNAHHCRFGALCEAQIGYDGPTGLGSPIGASGFGGTVGTGGGGGGGGGGTTNSPPTASFTQTCTDLSCTFADSSSDSGGTVTGWSWTFGDGGGSTLQNPSHTYSNGGTYNVTLTVTDNDGATDTTAHSVTVTAPSTSGITLTPTATR